MPVDEEKPKEPKKDDLDKKMNRMRNDIPGLNPLPRIARAMRLDHDDGLTLKELEGKMIAHPQAHKPHDHHDHADHHEHEDPTEHHHPLFQKRHDKHKQEKIFEGDMHLHDVLEDK